jgi:hypothetical protein
MTLICNDSEDQLTSKQDEKMTLMLSKLKVIFSIHVLIDILDLAKSEFRGRK